MSDDDRSRGEGVAAELVELLPRLPRVKITPKTISQNIIDRWYGYETEYRQTIADLRVQLAAANERADKAEAKFAEMTRCRNNALRYADREHVPVDLGDGIDTDGTVLAERLTDVLGDPLRWDWDNGDLPGVVAGAVSVIRPYLARFVDQARIAEAERDEAKARLAEIGKLHEEWTPGDAHGPDQETNNVKRKEDVRYWMSEPESTTRGWRRLVGEWREIAADGGDAEGAQKTDV